MLYFDFKIYRDLSRCRKQCSIHRYHWVLDLCPRYRFQHHTGTWL